MNASEKSKWLLAASTIAWFWAVLFALPAIGMMLPQIFLAKLPKVNLVWGILLFIFLSVCFAISGYGIRKQRKPFQWVATIWTAIVIGGELIIRGVPDLIGITSCITLVLVIVNWQRFI